MELTDTAGGDVLGVVSPAFVADAEGFDAFDPAVGVLAAVDFGAGVFAGFLGRSAHQRGQALAAEASWQVGAGGAGSTDPGGPGTFVDVDTESTLGLEPGPALAGSPGCALGVVGAVEIGGTARLDFGWFASRLAVALVAGWALTLVARRGVDALGPDAALVQGTRGTLINVCKKFRQKASDMSSYFGRHQI